MKIITSVPKRRYEYDIMFYTGLLVFFLSNVYFGWNETAKSGAERVFDVIWVSLMIIGGFSMMARSIAVEVFSDMEITVKSD